MKTYFSQALFIHTPETAHLIEGLRSHESQPDITPILVDDLMTDSQKWRPSSS